MGRFATGVAVVATLGPNGPHGMTANSLTAVSLAPPLLLFCAREGTRMGALVKLSKRFSVNILSREQEELSRYFAGQTRLPCEFEWLHLQDTPILADAEAAFVCDLHNEVGAGDHSILVGRVVAMHGRQQPRSPLVFYQGRYASVTPP
jgi:flavin reductase (DIM6/NTAB) family NADH-FMN oxidoreductase RutF